MEHDDLDRQIGVDTSRESEELKRAYEGDLEEREPRAILTGPPPPGESPKSARWMRLWTPTRPDIRCWDFRPYPEQLLVGNIELKDPRWQG